MNTHAVAKFGGVRSFSNPRPLSPHVTLYAFPLAALMSVSHRATGIVMTFGSVGISALAVFGSCRIQDYTAAFQLAAPLLVPFAKAGVAFSLTYHYLAGCRHLYWEHVGRRLELDAVNQSSKAIIGATAVLTAVAAFVHIN